MGSVSASTLIILHLLAAVVWVGGMFFAYLVLRPASGALEPVLRLPLWRQTLRRFFFWVWLSVILLPVTGYWLIFGVYSGFAHVGLYIHLMHGLGWLMILLFLHLYFAPYRRFAGSMRAGKLEQAATELDKIRRFVAINLGLGLLVVAIAGGGRYGLFG